MTRGGLLNPSNTCYVNSAVQQAYAILPLRQLVLEHRASGRVTSALADVFASISAGLTEEPRKLLDVLQTL